MNNKDLLKLVGINFIVVFVAAYLASAMVMNKYSLPEKSFMRPPKMPPMESRMNKQMRPPMPPKELQNRNGKMQHPGQPPMPMPGQMPRPDYGQQPAQPQGQAK